MRRLLVLPSLLLLIGCPPGAKEPAPEGPSASSPEAPLAPEEELEEPEPLDPDEAYVIRADKLERFIEYQEKTIALYSEMLREPASDPADASVDSAPSVARIRKHADAQERVRRELRLSERDVRELERVVGDVISRRAMAASVEDDASIREMEALSARLPEEKRGEFAATVTALKKQQEAVRTLAEERRKYGDANVDLVLTRETELMRQWNLAIATFAGTRDQKPQPARVNAGTPSDAGVDAGTPSADAGIPPDGGAPRSP